MNFETSTLSNLCLEWYFPVPTNKLLLLQQLLSHAVLGQLNMQIKQVKKGLKETGIWPLLNLRPDVVPVLFPRECEAEINPERVLQSIIWLHVRQTNDSDSDDLENETMQVTGFFRQFVEEASADSLRELMRFWVGWEVPCKNLKLEEVQSTGPRHLPTSSTCNECLRLPNHYTSYAALKADMILCLRSVESGFVLVLGTCSMP
ncbi:uncharacterized protein LOC118317415 [Scophthalmus maximus]|uniref:uncharacterized protein LOC118317415 n=1 Tax=Scophthalmus maximus TaxID=52904 RepID=UPI001FA88825|nr:uncharacterized protein LOC118317415 [Scophthalmus maximus]